MIETPAFQSELDRSPMAATIMVPRLMNQRYGDPLVERAIPEATEANPYRGLERFRGVGNGVEDHRRQTYKPNDTATHFVERAIPRTLKDVDAFCFNVVVTSPMKSTLCWDRGYPNTEDIPGRDRSVIETV